MPDLTTLANVKSWQGGIPATSSAADAKLARLITATSGDFLRAIKRVDLMTASYTEQRTGDGSPRIVLRHWPVTEVSAVHISGTAVSASPDSVQAGWFLDTNQDPEKAFVLYYAGGYFRDGASVSVIYNAGYVTVPDDIEQAVIEWVVLRYNLGPTSGQTQTRSSEGEHTDFDPDAMPPNTKRVIDAYTRTWPEYGRTKPTDDTGKPPRGNGGYISIPAR